MTIHTPGHMSDSLPTVPMTNAEIVAALHKRRTWARALDRANAAEHKRREADYLINFRTRCREAVRWDYQTVKANGGDIRESRRRMYAPDCPVAVLPVLDEQLKVIEARVATKPDAVNTLAPGYKSMWHTVYWLLFFDENAAPATVC